MYNTIQYHGLDYTELPRVETQERFTVNTKRMFKGTPVAIESIKNELEALGYACVVTEGPNHTLEATIPNKLDSRNELDITTAPRQQWEYTVGSATKDILESDHPLLVGGTGPTGEVFIPLEASHINSLKEWLKSGDIPAFDYYLGRGYINSYEATSGEDAYFASQYNQANTLYYLMASGVRTIEIQLPLIRTTSQLPSGYTDVGSLINSDGMLIANDTIQNTPDMPDWLVLVLNGDTFWPNASSGAVIPSDPHPTATYSITKHYAWLEKVGTLSETNEGRINVVIEYHWGLWAEDLYGTPV